MCIPLYLFFRFIKATTWIMDTNVTFNIDPDIGGFTEWTNLSATTHTPVYLGSATASDLENVQATLNVVGFIFTPTILIVGVFGNCMTILTMMSKSFSDLTSRYILIGLSLSDTTFLLLQPFNKMFIIQLIGLDTRALSRGGCKLFFWLFKTSKMTSSWLIVMLCFERFVAVIFPLKIKHILNKRNILVLVACVVSAIGVFNSMWSFASNVKDGTCQPDVMFPDTKLKYRNFLLMGTTIYSFVPITIILILTPTIVWKLIQKRRNRQRHVLQHGNNRATKKDSKEIRASLVIISVVVAFVILVCPIAMMFIISFWQNLAVFQANNVLFFVAREMTQLLEQINYSITFFLYIMCSDTFRRRALQILRRPCSGTRVEPLSRIGGMVQSTSNHISSRRTSQTSR